MKGAELEARALCAAVQIGFSHVGAGGARLVCNGGQHGPLSLSLSESCAEIQVVTYSENHCWLDPCLRCCVECSVVPSEKNVSDEPSRDGDTSVEKSHESNPMAAAAHADQGNPSVIGPTVSASSVPGSGSLSSNFLCEIEPRTPFGPCVHFPGAEDQDYETGPTGSTTKKGSARSPHSEPRRGHEP